MTGDSQNGGGVSLSRDRVGLGGRSVRNPGLKLRMLVAAGVFVFFAMSWLFVPVFGLPFYAFGGESGEPLVGALVGLACCGLLLYGIYWRGSRTALDDTRELTEADARDLFAFLRRECERREMAVPSVHVLGTSDVNAFAIGRRDDGHIVFTDGMLATMGPEELKAIAGHELTHLDNRDSTLMTLMHGVRSVVIAVWAYVGYVLMHVKYRDRVLSPQEKLYLRQKAHRRTALMTAVFMALPTLAISRYREYVADEQAAEMTDPRHMVSALRSLRNVEHDLDEYGVSSAMCIVGRTKGFLSVVRSTHPPLDRRIERLRRKYDLGA